MLQNCMCHYCTSQVGRLLAKIAYLRKNSKWMFRYVKISAYICKQKLRIYAEKEINNGDKARYSSEKTHYYRHFCFPYHRIPISVVSVAAARGEGESSKHHKCECINRSRPAISKRVCKVFTKSRFSPKSHRFHLYHLVFVVSNPIL